MESVNKGSRKNTGISNCIKSQASIFNGCANLYVPLFRQATIFILEARKNDHNNRAIDVAYTDVEQAFDYYMINFNKGKPFTLAGHSQGSELLLTLLKKSFFRQISAKKLIAAYVIGWSVTK